MASCSHADLQALELKHHRASQQTKPTACADSPCSNSVAASRCSCCSSRTWCFGCCSEGTADQAACAATWVAWALPPPRCQRPGHPRALQAGCCLEAQLHLLHHTRPGALALQRCAAALPAAAGLGAAAAHTGPCFEACQRLFHALLLELLVVACWSRLGPSEQQHRPLPAG